MSKSIEMPINFAAWPANYGLWGWGDELVTIFAQGHRGESEDLHARDKSKPFIPVQARAGTDGGETWITERFNGLVPGSQTLSGDEHVFDDLKAGPRIDVERDLRPLDEPIDFTRSGNDRDVRTHRSSGRCDQLVLCQQRQGPDMARPIQARRVRSTGASAHAPISCRSASTTHFSC